MTQYQLIDNDNNVQTFNYLETLVLLDLSIKAATLQEIGQNEKYTQVMQAAKEYKRPLENVEKSLINLFNQIQELADIKSYIHIVD